MYSSRKLQKIIQIRVDYDTLALLEKYCQKKKIKRSEAVRQGIAKLLMEEKHGI